jgi:hypothetical protein
MAQYSLLSTTRIKGRNGGTPSASWGYFKIAGSRLADRATWRCGRVSSGA